MMPEGFLCNEYLYFPACALRARFAEEYIFDA
jgi:hypothetical protein